MSLQNGIILFLCLLFMSSCSNDPLSKDSNLPLRDDFSETEFKQAIIGTWESVFSKDGEANVKHLEFDGDHAKLTIVIDSVEKEFEGAYTIRFLRPPAKDVVTFAELTISASDGDLLLSQMNFGLHNALPVNSGYCLRIDESPFGVLHKQE